jgi:class 3 adenylate cyclase/predicted ATPase
MSVDSIQGLTRYLPRVLLGAEELPPFWSQDGSLLFADVSGFTKLSERLAKLGRSGAEVLVGTISSIFTPLLEVSDSYGGDVLKFGGDALLIFFAGDDHLRRSCAAADEMRHTLRRVGKLTIGSRTIRLGMSQGIHSGQFDFFLVGGAHQELVVAGPAATTTVEMESAADAQEVLLSPQAATGVDERFLGEEKAGGRLLALAPPAERPGARPPKHIASAAQLDRYVPIALRGRLDTIVEESEHRQVTVAFLHFLGLDGLLVEQGPAEVHRRLGSLASAVVESMAEHGVCVICTDIGPDGGKFMLASGAPEAHEDAEERMLRAMRSVLDVDHGLLVRVGVNRGHVYGGAVGSPFRFTYSTMGDAVNLAARVMGKAAPGQLLATQAVVKRCEGRFEAEPLPPFMVKGKSKPVNALAVGQPRKGARTRRPEHGFVGRGPEVRQLEDAFRRAQAGHGTVVELVADAGVGKSRLVREVAGTLAPDSHLAVQCEQYEANTPYFAARSLLWAALGIAPDASPAEAASILCPLVAAAAPDLQPWLPVLADLGEIDLVATPETSDLLPRIRRQRLRDVVRRLLEATLGFGTLIVIEDSFWMDDASTDLLAPLLATVADRGWLVCLTRRRVPGGLHTGLGYRADVIELDHLTDEEAMTLLDQAAGTLSPHEARQLTERADGNPLFLLEMAAFHAAGTDVDGLPENVEAIISSRLDRLDPADRRLLRYASVLGIRFPEADLQHAVGGLLDRTPTTEDWERLTEFVERDPDGTIRFANDLFRKVAYEALPFARRRQTHDLVGQALEAAGGEDRIGLLSLHFHAAQRYDKAWQYSLSAGERARRLYANLEAVELYRRALDAARHLDVPAPVLAEVHEAMGDACEVTSQYALAERSYELARRRAPVEDPLVCTRLMLKQGVVRERQGRYSGAVRWYQRALRHLDEADPTSLAEVRAKLLVGMAATRYRQGRLRDCVDWAKKAAQAAKDAGHRPTQAHAYYLLDAALTDLGSSESVLYRSLALPIYEETGDLIGQADVLNNLGINAYYEGRWHEALELYERSRAARLQAGDVMGAATAANNIAEILSDQGRVDEAEALLREAHRVFRGVGYPVGEALVESNLGRAAARAGRYEDAAPLLDAALEGFREIGAEAFVLETEARIAELLLASHRLDEALTKAEAVLQDAGGAEAVVAATTLERIRGICLAASERPAEGRQALIASVQKAESSGAVFELAISQWALAQVERYLRHPRAIERLTASKAVLDTLEVRSLGTYGACDHLADAMGRLGDLDDSDLDDSDGVDGLGGDLPLITEIPQGAR